MPPARFEPATPAIERPQTYASDGMATIKYHKLSVIAAHETGGTSFAPVVHFAPD